mmetsp:Transcript_99815/g.286712  ORF Transcript_99815/g.286712 Transcript_99815/m.286712 type:complete len:304 (-) Transcript_99815:1283-2194(-)
MIDLVELRAFLQVLYCLQSQKSHNCPSRRAANFQRPRRIISQLPPLLHLSPELAVLASILHPLLRDDHLVIGEPAQSRASAVGLELRPDPDDLPHPAALAAESAQHLVSDLAKSLPVAVPVVLGLPRGAHMRASGEGARAHCRLQQVPREDLLFALQVLCAQELQHFGSHWQQNLRALHPAFVGAMAVRRSAAEEQTLRQPEAPGEGLQGDLAADEFRVQDLLPAGLEAFQNFLRAVPRLQHRQQFSPRFRLAFAATRTNETAVGAWAVDAVVTTHVRQLLADDHPWTEAAMVHLARICAIVE